MKLAVAPFWVRPALLLTLLPLLQSLMFFVCAGDMVYGAAYWPIAENDALAKLGFMGA